ncbi:hypothetical protein BGAL_0243g00020 [Botrytis galanthina]|uniref:Uncharacterized protein n=1 Tax=Botrytis galanthina TaxID=278940 RepID=A0A4S8QWX0_9HELO|nr:hypothetical protein BGAL_0243g00020 [Botrytis galanthina]
MSIFIAFLAGTFKKKSAFFFCSGDDPRTTLDHLLPAVATSIRIVKISTRHGFCGVCFKDEV